MAALQTNMIPGQNKQSWFDLFRGDIVLKPTDHTVTPLPLHCARVLLLDTHVMQAADGSHRKVTRTFIINMI